MADSDLDDAFIFRTTFADANISTAAIRSAHATQVTPGENREIELLGQHNIDTWIDAATQFTPEKNKEAIKQRFARLKLSPGFQSAVEDAADVAKWADLMKQSHAADPDGARHRQRLAAFLSSLACGADSWPYVARGLIDQMEGSRSRSAALADQLTTVRTRMEEGRKTPEKCRGVAAFTDDDWDRLEAIELPAAAPE